MSALSSYLAQDRLRALAAGADLPTLTSGAALFADISGFTPLTEALHQALGPRRGAEELTRLINQVYDALVVQVERWHGSVICFSGDALTCWFDDRHGAAAPRAATAALALQEAMAAWADRPIPGGASARLGLKVAVASGPARRFVIGNPTLQRLDTLAGATVARMAAGERLADQGEVVIDEATAAALGPNAALSAWRSDPTDGAMFAVLAGLTAPAPPHPWPLPPDTLAPEELQPWLLPAVAAREQAGLGTFLTELRPAVALFLRFTGIDYDGDPGAAAQLDRLIRGAQAEVARYDGALLQLTIGDKGAYLFICFGAPIAHEDDAARAVLAALALRTLVAELPFLPPVQIGLAAGPLRCGPYGGATRRSYSALGDAVNLAARLMQYATPGQILADAEVHRATAALIAWESLPPTTIKGKQAPVALFAVASTRRARITLSEPSAHLPLIGRAAEIAQISARLELALAGQGQIVLVEAEAGLGKSRLLAEAIRLARGRGLAGYGSACQATSTATPYLVWEPIIQALLDLAPASAPEQAAMLAQERAATLAPHHADAAPLLGPLLGLPLPDTPLTAGLTPQDRARALQALLIACLAGAAAQAQAISDQEGEALSRVAPAAVELLRGKAERALQLGTAMEARQLQAVALLARGNALLAQGQAAAAREDYVAAGQLRKELGQQHLVPVALAGEARAALVVGDQAGALEAARAIRASVAETPLAGLDEPIMVAQAVAAVLMAVGDPEAKAWQGRAEAHQAAVAERLADPARRAAWLARWAGVGEEEQ